MKKLLILALLLLPSLSFAQSVTATLGDRNSSGEYRVKADTDGVVTYASDTGIVLPYVNYASAGTGSSVTLTAAQSGTVITDTGGATPTTTGSCRKFVLPRAAPGLNFTFTTGGKCTMTIDTVDTSDQILYSISGTGLDAGDSIKSTGQAGESITLFSTVANKWSVKSNGSTAWTDNGTN